MIGVAVAAGVVDCVVGRLNQLFHNETTICVKDFLVVDGGNGCCCGRCSHGCDCVVVVVV